MRAADTPAGEVLAALRREPAKSFAAFDDPWWIAGRLERERAAHWTVLARRPRDVTSQLRDAHRALAAATEELRRAAVRVADAHQDVQASRRLRGLLPGRRLRHGEADRTLRTHEQDVEHWRNQIDRSRHHVGQLHAADQATRDFDDAEGWRHRRITELDRQLERHWTDVVLAAARAGDPNAYGQVRLEQAYRALLHRSRATLDDQLVQRNLADFERAVLASTLDPTVIPTPIFARAVTARRPGQWPEHGGDANPERGPGRRAGIGL